jgi:hypothetical protein
MVAREAPAGIKAVGWSCLVFGAFLLGAAALSLVLWILVPEAFGPALSAIPDELQGKRWIRSHWTAYTLGQAVVGAAHLAVGMGLLRLRAWARLALEGICWLALAGTIASVWGLRSTFSDAAGNSGASGWIIVAAEALVGIAQFVGLALLIFFLRRGKTREAFAVPAGKPVRLDGRQ